MPKNRRDKVVALTQTKKKGREWKGGLIENVREALEDYSSVYVFRCQNLRNNAFKELKSDLKETSRFFMGSNKVLQVALGKGKADEQREGLHQLAAHIKGHAGVVFTNLTKDDLETAMTKYEVSDFARTGTVATDTIVIDKGPVHGQHGGLMEHTLEPTLRKNGMPTKLNRGVIELLADHTVCKEGSYISPAGAILLRLFGHELATFKMDLLCCWTDDGSFEKYAAAEEGGEEEEGMDVGDVVRDRFKFDHVPSSMMMPKELMENAAKADAVDDMTDDEEGGKPKRRSTRKKAPV
mmetsp:Transcript_16377/g.40061  ORF Transcript_16377/g.40061 Transcript_16377/m.40061 type:complete len:295 (+) Transcript_16377:214-1098(+)